MRILSVSMTGFGPFKFKQTVDFSEYEADGLFLITGPTGAGKSTILDAICFALYGDTPRWHEPGVGAAQVRSDYCLPEDRTEVVLEFAAEGNHYRVARSPQYERPKERGIGTTTQQADALLERRFGDDWEALAKRPAEVGSHILSLVKLKPDEFLQVILLAQGRFQEFLLAKSEERLSLLGTLFDIGRFTDYDKRLDERRKVLKSALGSHRQDIATRIHGIAESTGIDEPGAGQELDWIATLARQAEADMTARGREQKKATKDEEATRDRLVVAERQEKRVWAQERLTLLESRKDEVAGEQTVLGEAERAERVRPLSEAATAAAGDVAEAEKSVETALSAYRGDKSDRLEEEVQRLDTTLGSLTPVVAVEEGFATKESDATEAQKQVDGIDTRLREIVARLKQLDELRVAATAEAKAGPSARLRADQNKTKVTAAREAADLAVQLTSAREGELTASKAFEAATKAYNELLDRYLHGQAAVLAQHLAPSEPCAVCGSIEHPSPAQWADAPVADSDLELARQKKDDAETPQRAAADLAKGFEGKIRALIGKTDGKSLSDLEDLEAGLDAAVRRADDADQTLNDIDIELNGNGSDQPGLSTEKTKLDTARIDASSTLSTAAAQLEADRRRVDEARGIAPTVAARVAELTAERQVAQSLLTAQNRLANAKNQLSKATSNAKKKAKDERFESVDKALSALLDPNDFEARKEALAEYRNELAGAKEVLALPDLQGLPPERIDVKEAADSASAATQRVKDLIAAVTEARLHRESMERQQGELEKEVGGIAELAERFETLSRLAATIHGLSPNTKNIPLESYVAAAELEAVLEAANARLRAMSDGRYELHHSERGDRRQGTMAGLEIEVLDEHTGRPRSPRSLSGGETFLASLALALGLAEVVTSRAGGIELKTMFIDEGFGSLDDETLGIAMNTLDTLRQGGRAVGVISHVDSMKESITSQLRVATTAQGWSEISHS
jgi:exonuclease SbcC